MSEEREKELIQWLKVQSSAWSAEALALIERQAAALKESKSELRQLRDFLTFTAGGDVYALIDKKAAAEAEVARLKSDMRAEAIRAELLVESKHLAEAEARQLREQLAAHDNRDIVRSYLDRAKDAEEEADQLRVQLAACERDAARWRLVERCSHATEAYDRYPGYHWTFGMYDDDKRGLAAAVDAAIAAMSAKEDK